MYFALFNAQYTRLSISFISSIVECNLLSFLIFKFCSIFEKLSICYFLHIVTFSINFFNFTRRTSRSFHFTCLYYAFYIASKHFLSSWSIFFSFFEEKKTAFFIPLLCFPFTNNKFAIFTKALIEAYGTTPGAVQLSVQNGASSILLHVSNVKRKKNCLKIRRHVHEMKIEISLF